MTDRLPLRAHLTRRLAAFAALGLVGAFSPLAVAAPAQASPESAPCPAGFGATAASDVLDLHALDLSPLGRPLPTLAALRLSSTRSGMAGGPPHAAAQANYLQAQIVGHPVPAAVLQAQAYQDAPPSHSHPVTVPTVGLDLGALSVGTGGLAASATWQDASTCQPVTGPHSQSSATIGALNVLPHGGNRALVHVGALGTTTSTQIAPDGHRVAAQATSTGSIADLSLFSGTPGAINVKVISQPKLVVTAGRQKTAQYTAPVLEVTVAGHTTHLSAAGDHVDLAVPVDAGSTGLADSLSRAEGLPAVDAVPLDSLLGRAGGASTAPAAFHTDGGIGDGLLGSLLGGQQPPAPDTSTAPESKHAGGPSTGKVVVLRLALGAMDKKTTATGIDAKASSLHLQLLSRSTWKGHADDGYGGGELADNTSLLDLGLCVLQGAANTPEEHGGGHSNGGYGGHGGTNGGGGNGGTTNGGGNGGTTNGGGNGGQATPPATTHTGNTLPLTGSPIALIIGAGVVLLMGGRLLMVLAKRRLTS